MLPAASRATLIVDLLPKTAGSFVSQWPLASRPANYRELVSVLVEQLQSVLGPGMTVPNEFIELFGWIERHGSQYDDRNGMRWGRLDRNTEEDSGAAIGTRI